jgi:hypothetical protein
MHIAMTGDAVVAIRAPEETCHARYRARPNLDA